MGKWRQRFLVDRVGGLADEPRACHASVFTADYPILSSRNGSTIVSGWPYQYVPQA